MQLADWLFTLLLIRSDDPHGRTALEMTLPPRPGPPLPVRTPQPR
jgi:hypothetical protein